MRSRVEVKAVWDTDLQRLLASLDMFDTLVAGAINCEICGCRVDLDNLGTIFSRSGGLGVSCDRSECVHAVTSKEP